MTENIQNPKRRTQAYWYVDGLVELGTGFLFILLGTVLIIESTLPPNTKAAALMAFVRNVILFGGSISLGPLIKAIKNHLTYPRTGFIAYSQPNIGTLGLYLGIGLLIAAMISGGLVLSILFIPQVQTMIVYLPSWLHIGLGILFGCVYLSWGLRTGLKRFYRLASLGALTGLLLAWGVRGLTLVDGQVFFTAGPGIFFLVMGAGLGLSGGITFRDYMHQTQQMNEEVV